MIRFVILLLLLAAVLYGIFWAIDRRNRGGESSSPARPLPQGPVGPDDDEAFLRNLDQERRRTHEDNPPPSSQENHDQPE